MDTTSNKLDSKEEQQENSSQMIYLSDSHHTYSETITNADLLSKISLSFEYNPCCWFMSVDLNKLQA